VNYKKKEQWLFYETLRMIIFDVSVTPRLAIISKNVEKCWCSYEW